MKLRQSKRERIIQPKAMEIARPVEAIENPFARIQLLLADQDPRDLENSWEIENYQKDYFWAYILQQAVPDLDFSDLERKMRQTFIWGFKSKDEIQAELEKNEFDSSIIHTLAEYVSCYPEQRSTISIPDTVFNHWVKLLDERDRPGSESISAHEVVQTLFDLLILRPDQQAELQEYLHGHGWDEVLWMGKKIEVGAGTMAAAQVRVIEPRYKLTEEEKKAYLREYQEVKKIDILNPPISDWAALAILLSPEVEVSNQGRVVLKNNQRSMGENQPLPDRMVG